MSDYDPTSDIITGTDTNVDAIIDALQELCTYAAETYDISNESMASATAATINSDSVAIEADDILLIIGWATVSTGTADATVKLQIDIDGSPQTPAAFCKPNQTSGSTAGNSGNLRTIVLLQDQSAGTVTVSLQWSRSAGSGTIYSDTNNLVIIKFKKKS